MTKAVKKRTKTSPKKISEELYKKLEGLSFEEIVKRTLQTPPVKKAALKS